MRQVFVAILLLLLATPCQAAMPYLIGGPLAADHCTGCVMGDADVLCEDFENSGTGPVCAGWTVNDDGDGSVTFEAHPAALTTCTDEGSYAMKIVHADAVPDGHSDVDQFAEFDMGEAKDHVFIQGWFYIDSLTIADDLHEFLLVGGTHAVEGSQDFYVYIKRVDNGGTQYYLDGGCWQSAAFGAVAPIGSTAITLDAWHRLVIEYDDGDIFRVYLDGNATPEFSEVIDAGKDTRYIYFGSFIAAEEDHTVWWDNIKIDETAAPGDCL